MENANANQVKLILEALAPHVLPLKLLLTTNANAQPETKNMKINVSLAHHINKLLEVYALAPKTQSTLEVNVNHVPLHSLLLTTNVNAQPETKNTTTNV